MLDSPSVKENLQTIETCILSFLYIKILKVTAEYDIRKPKLI